MYAKVIDGVVLAYPYSLADLKADNPATSFPSAPTDEQLADYGMLPVLPSAAPDYDAMTQRIIDATPIFDGGSSQWVAAFEVVELSAEEIAALAKQKSDDDDIDTLRSTTFMTDMLTMSADDFENKLRGDITNVATLTNEFVALAKVVQVIAKLNIK